jgi:arabinan endo-1,5-alpha-L-arabinosidase
MVCDRLEYYGSFPNQAEITVNGAVYDGVFVRLWDPVSQRYVMTFTAMSREGVSVWGSRLADRTDAEIVTDVENDLNLGDTSSVISNLELPTEGTRHAQIAWHTSDPGVVTETGVVHRPPAGSSSATAVLTATVTKGSATATKSFEIAVLPYRAAGLAAHYAFDGDLSDATGSFGAGTPTGDRIDNSGGSIAYADGISGQAAVFDGASGVLLPKGLLQSDTYTVSLWVKPEKLTMFTTTFFGARDSNNWVSLVPNGPAGGNTMVWSGSARWYDAPAGLTIPTGQWTHLAFAVDNGAIRVYVNGEGKFSGTDFPDIFTTTNTSFSLGVNWWDPPFKGLMDDLRIYEGALTLAEIRQLAAGNE